MDEKRIKKNLRTIFLTNIPKNNVIPINETKKPITYEYVPNKNKSELDVKAPKCPKKFVISPND